MRGVDWPAVAPLLLVLAAFVGWVMNIVKLASSETLFTGMNAVRAIGIFLAPMGAVLGFF